MMKKLKVKFLLWFMQTKLYYFIMFKLFPSLRFSTGYTLIRGWQYWMLYQVLEPSDFVLIIDYSTATGMAIRRVTGGQFSHAAMCVEKNSVWEISEMLGSGYTKSTFYDLCREADRVVILSSDLWDEKYKKAMVELCKCEEFQRAEYDVWYDMMNDRKVKTERGSLNVPILACSELCYRSDFENRVKFDLEDVCGIGKPYISPQGLYDGKGMKVKADSKLLKKPEELKK